MNVRANQTITNELGEDIHFNLEKLESVVTIRIGGPTTSVNKSLSIREAETLRVMLTVVLGK